MAVDKLVDSTQLNNDLTSVANAIRTKGGTSAQLAFPAGFVSAVQAIPTGGVTPTGTYTIEAPGTYDISNYQYVEVDIDMWTEQTISTAGAVTQALSPYVIYHFTGALTSLTITLTAAAQGQIAHYHFDFDSPSTAATLNLPVTVETPDGFAVEASTHYEVDILNNYATVQGW